MEGPPLDRAAEETSPPGVSASSSVGPAFLDRLRRRDPAAVAELFDAHVQRVDRVVSAVLGPDDEVGDVVQETYVQALASLPSFRGDVGSLRAWLTRVAVHTARRHIRSRRRRRWLRPGLPDLDVVAGDSPDPGTTDALRRTYLVLAKLPEAERTPFALRHLQRMELSEVAHACDVSLATIKRRLTRARSRFERLAARDPVLIDYLRGEA